MSKGSRTTTTQTGPPPNVSAAFNQLISNTQALAQTPYVPYTGEGVAPVNQQQYYGIGNINANALAAQPDYSLAGGYFKDAAAPLTPDQIMTYYDPFQQNVIKTTQEQFDQMNQMALNNIQGNAGVQGALGGDRSAVADAAYYQGALPGQEQAIASLEAQGYTNAAAMAAGQFQQNPMYAGYGLANLGTGAQQAALQGASAQLAAGGLEQQTSQALDQYLYNQYLAQQGFPFMENQYAAGIIGGIGSLSGGYGTTTAPAPSVFAQLLGLGTAGAGAYGAYQGAQNKTSAAGGRVKGYQTGGSPVMPYSGAQSYVPSGQLGLGRSTLPTPPQAPGQQSGASGMFGEASQLAGMGKMGQGLGSGLGNLFGGSAAAADPTEAAIAGTGLPMDIAAGAGDATGALAAGDMAASAGDAAMLFLLAQGGGRINYPGGLALPGKNRIQMPMRGGMGMPSFVRGYQGGGTPSFADRFEGDPNYGEIYLAQQKAREAYDPKPVPTTTIPASQIAGDPIPGDVSTSSAGVLADDSGDLPGRTPVGSKIAPPGLAYAPENAPPGGGIYAPSGVTPPPLPPRMEPSARPQIVPGQGGQGFLGMSPEFWASLIPAGLGMMAAARPGVPTGVAIGQGGLEGFSAYGSMKKGEADIEMQARKLDQAAQAEQDRIALEGRREQFQETQMTPYQRQSLAQQDKLREETLAQQREFREVPVGYRKTPAGGLEPVPGGPADPNTVGALAVAKMQGGLMSDAAVDLAVSRIKAGDPSALQNLGRGAQTGINLTKIQNRLAERAQEEGWSGADIAAARANFTSQSAAARTMATREANVQASIEEARQTFGLAEEASKALPRSSFVPWNQAVQAVQAGTSSPELARYVTALRGVMTAYAQAMSRTGVTSVHSQQAAEDLLNKATGHEGVMATLDQMRKEMDAAAVAPEMVRQTIMDRIKGGGAGGEGAKTSERVPSNATPTAGTAAAPKVGDRKQFKQGWGVWDGTKYVPEAP